MATSCEIDVAHRAWVVCVKSQVANSLCDMRPATELGGALVRQVTDLRALGNTAGKGARRLSSGVLNRDRDSRPSSFKTSVADTHESVTFRTGKLPDQVG